MHGCFHGEIAHPGQGFRVSKAHSPKPSAMVASTMASHGTNSKVLKTNSAIVCRAVKSMLTGACSVLDSRGRVRYGDKCVATKRTRDVICSKLKSQAVMRHSGVLVHASAFSGSAENLRSSQILFTKFWG